MCFTFALGIMFQIMIEDELNAVLFEAAGHFRSRGIPDWELGAQEAVNKIESNDFSFAEDF